MYPDPFYNTDVMYPQMNPMWMQMPPGFSPMPFPEPANLPGGGFDFPPAQGYPFQGFNPPPPPPDFSGFYPGY